MLRAVGLFRVSTKHEEQESSLKNQEEMYYTYVKNNNMISVGTYIEQVSGTKMKSRVEFKRLIADAKEKKFDVVIIKNTARLARNIKVTYEFKELIEQHGIHLVALNGEIDTIKKIGVENLGLFAWINEKYSIENSKNIKSAFNNMIKKGLWMRPKAPYGYILKEKKLYPAEQKDIDVVNKIFNLFLDGWGPLKIARHFNLLNLPTPYQIQFPKIETKGLWHENSIRHMLTNRAYIGDIVQNTVETTSVTTSKMRKRSEEEYSITENAHEAIVPKDVFFKAQELLKDRKLRGKGKVKAQKNKYTNYLFCADCGTAMWRTMEKKYPDLMIYCCGRYIKFGNKFCTRNTMKEHELDKIILDDIKQILKKLNKANISKKITQMLERNESDNYKRKKDIENELSKLKTIRVNLVNLLASKEITQDDYNLTAKSNSEKEKKLKSELKNFLNIQDKEIEMINTDFFKNEIEKVLNKKSLSHEDVARLIKRISVNKTSINIEYNFINPELTS